MPDGGPACPANINSEEKKKRWILGISFSALAFAGGLFMISSNASDAGRILIFIPAFFGALGFFQARQSVCVFYAYRNERKIGKVPEPVQSGEARKALRASANRIFFKAAAAAGAWTLLVIFL